MDREALYRSLEESVASMPDLRSEGSGRDPEVQRWLGRAAALIEQVGDLTDLVNFKAAVDGVGGRFGGSSATQVSKILYRALARAELKAPASARGAFIPVGAPFDVFAVLAQVLAEAKHGVLLVDPYLDSTVLTDFAGLVPEGVQLQLLTDGNSAKWTASLKPAVAKWTAQYGSARPLEAKQSAPGALHDRLVLVDGSSAWAMSQSLKDFAKRASGSVSKLQPEIASLKFPAYQSLWASAIALG